MKFLSEWAKFILRCSNKIAFIIIFLIIYVPKVSMGHKRKLRKQKWLSPIDCNSHAPSADTRDVKNALKKPLQFCILLETLKKNKQLTLLLFHLIISLAIRTFILTFSQLHEVLYTNMMILCLKIVILYRLKTTSCFRKSTPL